MSCIPNDQYDTACNECVVTVVFPTVALKGEDVKNCQVNDELVGPIYQAKLEGARPSEQNVKEKDPKYHRLVQIWDQLVIKDEVLWRLFESNNGSRHT